MRKRIYKQIEREIDRNREVRGREKEKERERDRSGVNLLKQF